jgi:hypothetical protein
MAMNIILSSKGERSAVPYPGTDREESPHQGFVILKGRPEQAATIPATVDNNALVHALTRINAPATPFFTVACRKSLNSGPGSYWARGYIEFAFNFIEIAKDSPNYFLLFEQFNGFAAASGCDLPVDFEFELRRTEFSDISAEGHTVCVWITTAEFPSPDGANLVWAQSVGLLADFLGSFSKPELPAIY